MFNGDRLICGAGDEYNRGQIKRMERRYEKGLMHQHRYNLPGDKKIDVFDSFISIESLGYKISVGTCSDATDITVTKDDKCVATILKDSRHCEESILKEYEKDVNILLRLNNLHGQPLQTEGLV